MTMEEIRKMPTSISKYWGESEFARGSNGLHESVLRYWHIVQKLRQLIEAKTPHAVLLEIIEDLTQPKGD